MSSASVHLVATQPTGWCGRSPQSQRGVGDRGAGTRQRAPPAGPDRCRRPGPAPAAISKPGDAEQAYLATVSWWGPADGDPHRAAALGGHLWDKDLEGMRSGCDPFGRLVLHNPTTGAFALEWPRALPAAPYPNAAEIIATPQNMTAFIALPDGRCDIAPTDPRVRHTEVPGATALHRPGHAGPRLRLRRPAPARPRAPARPGGVPRGHPRLPV